MNVPSGTTLQITGALCIFFVYLISVPPCFSLPLLVSPELYWFPHSTWFRASGFAEQPEDSLVCKLTSWNLQVSFRQSGGCSCMIAQQLLWLARLVYCHCWQVCLVRCMPIYFASWLTTGSFGLPTDQVPNQDNLAGINIPVPSHVSSSIYVADQTWLSSPSSLSFGGQVGVPVCSCAWLPPFLTSCTLTRYP